MAKAAEIHDDGPPWYRSTRYMISVIAFFGMFNTFLHRTDLSMAIVCMVNHTAVDLMSQRTIRVNESVVPFGSNSSMRGYTVYMEKPTSGNATFLQLNQTASSATMEGTHLPHSLSCRHKITDTSSAEREDGELVWSKETQGLVLGGLFWGYVVLQFVCAYIIRRWGPKLVVASGMLFMSVLSLLTPVSAKWSPWALLVLRAFVGVCNAFTVPGLYAIWTKWAPPAERSRLVAISFSGNMAATAAVFPMSALLCKLSLAGGWPLIFYIYGGLSLCWTIIWIYSVYDDPVHHPRVHPKERQFLQEVLGTTKRDTSIPTPWLKIFTSLPYLSIVCAHFTYNWGLFLMMSNLPIYMREIMLFDIKSNGFYSFIPFLVMVVTVVLGSLFADALIGRQILSVALTRKLMTILGHFLPAVLLIVVSYLDCTQSQGAVAILSIGIGLCGFAFSGMLVNFYDIAPMFGAPIMTISNAIAAIPGILAPYAVAEITKDKTREQWQIVFFLTAGLLTLGALTHLVFGRGHVQPWAILPEPTEEKVALPSS